MTGLIEFPQTGLRLLQRRGLLARDLWNLIVVIIIDIGNPPCFDRLKILAAMLPSDH